MARELSTIGVVGLGIMGAGIAEVFARNGFVVIGVEQSDELLRRGRAHVQGSTDRAVRRGKLEPEEQQAVLDRLTLTTSLSDLADCDLVVEAVVERLDLKCGIFQQLDGIVAADAVLATNTSSLSVTEIAVATSHPGRVVGMHFFNPAPVQRLVEVVHTVVTETMVVSDVEAVARRLGKNPVSVGDKAGFIANALLFGYLNAAAAMVETRHATREDIDAAMRLGCGYPMGPLALLDLIGLDTAYEILETMYRETGNRLHAPTPLLGQLVTSLMLGRKTGRGFYTYEGPGSPVVVADADTATSQAPPEVRRPVRLVGVLGDGELASQIAAVFTDAGFDVTRTADDAGLVVDATGGDLEATRALFAELDKSCRPGAILTTVSPELSVSAVAAATTRPGDVVGMHFVRPATPSGPVEVIPGVLTAAHVTETVRAICGAVGRHAVTCRDRAGFVVEALLVPYLNDAVRMLEAHYASADDIDTAMKQGCALPQGPFEVLDALGVDAVLAAQQRIYDEVREPGLVPARLLRQLGTAGPVGRGTGRGFRAAVLG